MTHLQSLDKALDLFIEFKFCESDFYFLMGAKIVWWLLITSVQCISVFKCLQVSVKSTIHFKSVIAVYKSFFIFFNHIVLIQSALTQIQLI